MHFVSLLKTQCHMAWNSEIKILKVTRIIMYIYASTVTLTPSLVCEKGLYELSIWIGRTYFMSLLIGLVFELNHLTVSVHFCSSGPFAEGVSRDTCGDCFSSLQQHVILTFLGRQIWMMNSYASLCQLYDVQANHGDRRCCCTECHLLQQEAPLPQKAQRVRRA